MFFILLAIEIIGTIAILVSYGIVSLVGVVHITFSKARVMLFPPPTIFTIPVIHFMLNLWYNFQRNIRTCRTANQQYLLLPHPVEAEPKIRQPLSPSDPD